MTKLPLLPTKEVAATKKKDGKIDLFQSKLTKSCFLLYCMLSWEFVVCLPPLFISFLMSNGIAAAWLSFDWTILWCHNCFLLSIQTKGVTFFPNHIGCICHINVDKHFIVDESLNNVIVINDHQVQPKTSSWEPTVILQVVSIPNQLAYLQRH